MRFFKGALCIGFLISSVILLSIITFLKPYPATADWSFTPDVSPTAGATPTTPVATAAPTNTPFPTQAAPPTPTQAPNEVIYTVTGIVFIDRNGSGTRDGTEQCYNGQVTVRLYLGGNLRNATTFTQDASCSQKYTFSGLAVGTYQITIDAAGFPAGYLFTTSNPFTFAVP